MIQASEIPVVPIFFFQDYDPFFFSGNHVVLSQKASSISYDAVWLKRKGKKEKTKLFGELSSSRCFPLGCSVSSRVLSTHAGDCSCIVHGASCS